MLLLCAIMWHHDCHVLNVVSIAFYCVYPLDPNPLTPPQEIAQAALSTAVAENKLELEKQVVCKTGFGDGLKGHLKRNTFFFVCVDRRKRRKTSNSRGSRNISLPLTTTLMYSWWYPLGRQWTYLQTFEWQVTCDGNCVVVFPFGFVFLKLLLPLMNMESGLHVNTLGFVKVCSPWWCPTRCYGAGQDPCNSPPWEIVTPWRHCRIYSFIVVIRVSLSRVPLLCWPFTLLEPFDSPWSCVLFQGVPCDMLMRRSLVHETLPESLLLTK